VKVLGIDSASTAGWAIVEGERLLEHGTVDARDPMRVHHLVGDIVTRHRPELAVIEQAYVARGPKANPEVTMMLSRLIGRWEMALALRAVPTELVNTKTWQTEILAGLITIKSKREACKAAAALWARGTYRISVSGDAADAIGIATWAARRALVAARQRRAG
jgi:Holliday junction resolvasome RuvABC endonuclease subunit